MTSIAKRFLVPLVASTFILSNASAATLSASQLLPTVAPSVDRVAVATELVKLGLSEKEATERLARISDAELVAFSQQAQHGPAGAGKTSPWAVAAGVALVAVLVYMYK